MAASSPRKAPAKKAAPRKAPAKRTPEQRAEDHTAAFDELRARALGMGLSASPIERKLGPPYVITAAEIGDGIDEDAQFQRPLDLVQRINLTRMLNQLMRLINDNQADEAMAALPDVLIAMSDGRTFNRVLRALAKEPDGDALLFALAVRVVEHFSGRGAVNVPGGGRAS